MSCCCLKTLDLCKFPVCGSLIINQHATAQSGSGETNSYDLVLDFLETQIMLTEDQTDGENIHFDISMLNENFQYTGKIYDSNGNLVTITIGEDEYDCIKFKTILNVTYS